MRSYKGLGEIEAANVKGMRYLASFNDPGYGQPLDDMDFELFGSIKQAGFELWRRIHRGYGMSVYVDTVPDAKRCVDYPCVSKDATITLYRFDVVNGEVQRAEYPDCELSIGPRQGVKVERF